MGSYVLETKTIKEKRHTLSFQNWDLVRLSHKNMLFDRSYDEHFTRDIFKIKQRMRMQGIPMYKVKDFQNEPIKGNFYESELRKVQKDEDTLWFIEKKLKKRKRNGEIQVTFKCPYYTGWKLENGSNRSRHYQYAFQREYHLHIFMHLPGFNRGGRKETHALETHV